MRTRKEIEKEVSKWLKWDAQQDNEIQIELLLDIRELLSNSVKCRK